MNENDKNALKFRDEFIKLCKKYNSKLFGSCRDDGNMCLEIYDKKNNWTSQYIMKDIYEKYSLYQEDEDYNETCIMDYIINKHFDNESNEMAGLNNIKISCGVITNDFGKASLKFQELRYKYKDEEVKRFVISKDCMELRLKNNYRYIWIKPYASSKGYRCGKIIIDRNVTLEELENIVMPMCYACRRDDVEIF